MRDFTWNVFTATGNVDAYLLYKEIDGQMKKDRKEENLSLEASAES
jgi:hypothetical protein